MAAVCPTPAAGWTPGPYPFAFAHGVGYGAVSRVTTLEAAGWQRVGAVPGLAGLWVMKRAAADSPAAAIAPGTQPGPRVGIAYGTDR